MISRDQLKKDIDSVNDNDLETLHRIIQALRKPLSKPKDIDANEKPLLGSIIFEKDLISPISEPWDADQ
ncbi:MAG TPA: hypothetical protein DCG57_17885 [Candidatus Riflebacteria bacterium]|jgi:hypothetical protein|nr:hypothetical protein [Candidatus Riflebacteria bacterium]